MATDPLGPLLHRLHSNGRLRVWSIVITIFGDAIVPRGGQVPLAELLTLTERMGIAPNALRAAMSRLAKDGWVEREKTGRTSTYSLSALGTQTFGPATEQIYADAFTKDPMPVHLALHPTVGAVGEMQVGTDALNLRPGVSLLFGTPPSDGSTLLAKTGEDFPDWTQDEVAACISGGDYADLATLLDALDTPPDTPLDALCLRVLLIHYWRRLVLRHPPIPLFVLPKNWSGHRAQERVKQLYKANLDLSERWWATPTPKAGRTQLSARFAM